MENSLEQPGDRVCSVLRLLLTPRVPVVALSTCFLSLFFFTRTDYRTELVPELAATDLSNSGGLHGSPPPAWASLSAAYSAPCLATSASRRRSDMGFLQRRG